jgi:predicted PurR-regulated permease PerM
VLVFYAIYTQVENAYLTPRIMRSSVNLPGLAVLIALLAGSALAGVVGALVAVPTAALLAVLIDEYVVQKDPDEPEDALRRGVSREIQFLKENRDFLCNLNR